MTKPLATDTSLPTITILLPTQVQVQEAEVPILSNSTTPIVEAAKEVAKEVVKVVATTTTATAEVVVVADTVQIYKIL